MINDTDLRGLRVLHAALVIGCVLALVVAGVASPAPHVDGPWFSGQFEVIGAGALALIPVSFVLFNRSLVGVRANTGKAQQDALRAALIVHWALIEAPALINAGLCFVEVSKGNLLAGGVAVAVLVSRMPSRSRVDGWCLGS